MNLSSEGQSSCPPVCGRRQAIFGSVSRTRGWQNASQFGAPPGLVVLKRLICKFVQLPGLHILFNLFVPGLGDELVKPRAEAGQLLKRQMGNCGFYFFNRGHTVRISDGAFSVKPAVAGAAGRRGNGWGRRAAAGGSGFCRYICERRGLRGLRS